VIDLIFALGHRHGTTLVLVTHDERLADRCERVVRMADGRISGDTASTGAIEHEAGPSASSAGATA
jgi:putative ABC transport system ATP-binding protein